MKNLIAVFFFAALIGVSSLAAAESYYNAKVDWVGVRAKDGRYMMHYFDESNGFPSCQGNWIRFDRYYDGSELVDTPADYRDHMLSVATSAFLSGHRLRVGIDVVDGQCYTMQMFMRK